MLGIQEENQLRKKTVQKDSIVKENGVLKVCCEWGAEKSRKCWEVR